MRLLTTSWLLLVGVSACHFEAALALCREAGRCPDTQAADGGHLGDGGQLGDGGHLGDDGLDAGGSPDAHVALTLDFGPPSSLSTSNSPEGVAVGDLNGDGLDDLVVSGDQLSVFLG